MAFAELLRAASPRRTVDLMERLKSILSVCVDCLIVVVEMVV